MTILSHNWWAEICVCKSILIQVERGWVVVDNLLGEGSNVNAFLLLIDCSSVLGFL